MIDIYPPNIELFQQQKFAEVTPYVLDVRKSLENFGQNSFNLIVFSQGPEHLEKNEAFHLINSQFKRMSTYIIIETPRGEYPQDELYGNEAEKHLSTWDYDDFHGLGFITSPGEKEKHIIGIWKKINS